MVPISLHIGILESCPSSPSHVFPGTGPKWRSKKINGASGMLGMSLHLFSYLYLSWFHKGLELVVWDSKKKGGGTDFFSLPSPKQQQ